MRWIFGRKVTERKKRSIGARVKGVSQNLLFNFFSDEKVEIFAKDQFV